MKSRVLRTTFLIGFVLVCIAAASQEAPRPLPAFDHELHYDELETCTDCHIKKKGNELLVLDKELCTGCHDEAPAYELPGRARRLHAKFPHQTHVDAFDCLDCHRPTLEKKHVAGEPLVSRKACVACHKENGIEVADQQCTRCHGRNERRVAPPDHKKAWLSKHGSESKWRVFDTHGKTCTLCHAQNVCQNCHKTARPESHTELWRERMHGIQAGWSRESCTTCHETGVCVQCHRTTPPSNHSGAWSSIHGLAAQTQSNQSCAACHSLAWCSACHRGEQG